MKNLLLTSSFLALALLVGCTDSDKAKIEDVVNSNGTIFTHQTSFQPSDSYAAVYMNAQHGTCTLSNNFG